MSPAAATPAKRCSRRRNRSNCDLLVKGAYTQSRLRQMIFGGATRHIIANATLAGADGELEHSRLHGIVLADRIRR